MKTGQFGDSPVPGSEMPMFAAFDSPGPFTTHPITATVIASTPGWVVFHDGIIVRTYCCTRSANSWNVDDVVRPQPGHAVIDGENVRRPSACRISHAA